MIRSYSRYHYNEYNLYKYNSLTLSVEYFRKEFCLSELHTLTNHKLLERVNQNRN